MNVGAARKVGEVGLDMEPLFETTGKVEVPHGLGIVEEFAYLRDQTAAALPGPRALPAEAVTS